MSYRYTLKIGSSTYILDSLINSATTTIKTPLCSTELKSASGSLSFSLIGARDTVYYATVIQAILTARDNTSVLDTEITLAEIDDTNNAVSRYLFRGYLDNNNFSLSTKKLPDNVTLTARDKTTLLDTKIRFNRIYEGQTRKYILEKLLEDLTTDTSITATLLSYPTYLNDTSANSKYKVSNWCVAEDDGDTYRERIDTLLYEAPGCVLYYDHNSDGYRVAQLPTNIISNYSSSSTYKIGDLCKYNSKLYSCIVAITSAHAWVSSEWSEVRGINYLSKSSSLQTSAGVYKYDGLLLKYPTISTRQNQNLYAENINTGIDSDGNITGLDVVDDGYFPENGDITATYQQYSDEGLDRAYITKESRLKNEDISLLYAKDCEYVISQHPTGACTLVTSALPNIGWTGSAQYYPKKGWVLLQNTSGDDATITGFSIQGTAIYKSKMNKLTVPSACSNPEEYETETIFENTSNSDSLAKEFAQWMFNAKKYGCTTTSWDETEARADATISKIGDVVNVIHSETGIAIPHIVVQVDAVGLNQYGTTRKFKVTAVSISGYSAYQSKKISNIPSIGIPTNATKVLITSKEFALSDSSVLAPETGWTSDRSSLTPTLASPYIWSRESMTYGDGTVQTSNPYVLEVYTTSEVLEYSLKASPSNVIKNLRSNGSQSITLSANISGYSGYVVNYMFAGQFIGSTYGVTSDQSAVEGKSYYVFAQTSDQTPQTGKTYYTVASAVYTEAVNISTFVSGATYYERSTVQYASGVYEETFNAHTSSISVSVPYVNNYSNKVAVGLYNGSTQMDSVELTIVDTTGEPLFIGATTTIPPTYTGNFISGDYCVYYGSDTPTLKKGRTYKYNGSTWAELTATSGTATEFYNSVKALQDQGVKLSDISDENTINYFNAIYSNTIIAGQIKAVQGFFVGITIESATFNQGSLQISQIKTCNGVAGDPNGQPLPAYSKWNVREVYDAIQTENSILSASGNYGGNNVSQAIKLTNPNAIYSESSQEQVTFPYASSVVTYTIQNQGTTTGEDVFTFEPPYFRSSKSTFRRSDVSVYRNGVFIYHHQEEATKVTTPQLSFTTSASIGDVFRFEFSNTYGADADGYLTISHPARTFSQVGFPDAGLLLNTGSWQNIGINTLYPSATSLSLTISGTTYAKDDHYADSTAWATYNYNSSMSAGNTYQLEETSISYQGQTKTASLFQKVSNTTSKVITTDGTVIECASGVFIYAQGTIRLKGVSEGLETKSIYPMDEVGASYDLGSSVPYSSGASRKWNNIHANTVNATTSNATSVVATELHGTKIYQGSTSSGEVQELHHIHYDTRSPQDNEGSVGDLWVVYS